MGQGKIEMEVINEFHHPHAVVPTPGHHYIETWVKSDFFCPNCGVKEVWTGGGSDYYMGCGYLCTKCKCSMHLDSCHTEPTKNDNELLIIKQLLSGDTAMPTTPPARS